MDSYLDPVVINGDAALDAFPNKTGNGTAGNPYTIANITIDGNWGVSCMNISGVTQHLLIANCTFTRGARGKWFEGAGIYADKCTNLVIENCTIEWNDNGIILHESHDCVVFNNTISNNQWDGITIEFSSNSNNITHNTIKDNMNNGIQLRDSNLNYIYQNEISGTIINDYLRSTSSGSGIYLQFSTFNNISQNTISRNDYYGIYLDSSDNNTVQQNVLDRNEVDPVFEWDSVFNDITGNIITETMDYRVELGLWIIGIIVPLLVLYLTLNIYAQSRKKRGKTGFKLGPRKQALLLACIFIVVIVVMVLIPIDSQQWFYHGQDIFTINYGWGSFTNNNPEGELEWGLIPPSWGLLGFFIFTIPTYLGLGHGIVTIYRLLRLALKKEPTGVLLYNQVGKAGWYSIVYGALLGVALGGPQITLPWEPSYYCLQVAILPAIGIVSLIIASKNRRGPWIIPPTTWEQVGNLKEKQRELTYTLTELNNLGKEGPISMDQLVMVFSKPQGEVKRKLRGWRMKHLITGLFDKDRDSFTLQGINLPLYEHPLG